MRMLRFILKKILRTVFIMMIFLIVVTSTGLFLFKSTPGVYLAYRLAQYSLPGRLHVEQLEGQLVDQIHLKNVTYTTPTQTFYAKNLDARIVFLSYHPFPLQLTLIGRTLTINREKQVASIKRLDFKGAFSHLTEGHFSLITDPFDYTLSEHKPFSGIKITLKGNLSPEGLTTKGTVMLDPKNQLAFTTTLPHWRLNHPFKKDQPIQGQLSYHRDSIAELESIMPIIQDPEGRFEARLTLKGTLGQPQYLGELLLKNAHTRIPQWGLALDEIHLDMTTQADTFKSQGSAMANGQLIHIEGHGLWRPTLQGDFKIQGENVPIIKTAHHLIHATSTLALHIAANILKIEGDVLIPSARLGLERFNKTLRLSEDVVIEKPEVIRPVSPFIIDTHLRVQMGQNVLIQSPHFKGRLTGEVTLTHQPPNPLTAEGTLAIEDGEYNAYGKSLMIDEGILSFKQSPLDNPAIRLRAIRKINQGVKNWKASNQLFDFNVTNIQTAALGQEVTVGVALSGRIANPKIQLFSIPSTLSESDILSMLILGRPANQANQAGGELLLAAMSSMNLDEGSSGLKRLENLQKALGIEVSVQGTSTMNQKTRQFTETKSLIITKSLSKRLSISYNKGITQPDMFVLTLKYLLNQFFSIEVTSTPDGNGGIDLFYSRRGQSS